jgi:hypothetical protein
MARKTEKGGKFRNVHCRTWNMARKLKIMENKKHPLETRASLSVFRENFQPILRNTFAGEKGF